MPDHEFKHCQRCYTAFECKVGSVYECQCADANLDQQQRDYISSMYSDCLCVDCLRELASEYNIRAHKQRLMVFMH